MDNFEKIVRELQGMDRSKRNELMDTLGSAMSQSQQKKLMDMMSDRKGKNELKEQLDKLDLEALLGGVSGKADLSRLLESDEIRQKLRDILG